MTPEQQELNRKFFHAITTLNIAIPHFWTKNDEPTDASKMLESACDVFKELHEDWRRHIGDPVTIKPAVIARELRQLADRIESEESHHELLKNLRQRISQPSARQMLGG